MVMEFISNDDYWTSESHSVFLFAVESEAKAKTRVRFEEIFRHHAGLADAKKSKKKKFHTQENIVVSCFNFFLFLLLYSVFQLEIFQICLIHNSMI